MNKILFLAMAATAITGSAAEQPSTFCNPMNLGYALLNTRGIT